MGETTARMRQLWKAYGALGIARRLVNGGSNGLDRFVDAYQRGLRVMPA